MTLPAEALDVSVLVPAKDEAPNLPEFVRQCDEALRPAGFSFEVIVVDDGSRDESARVLRELSRQYPFLRVVTHRRQRGIADALRSAGEVARGDIFVFYPADLQYLPADIPGLVAPILDGRADIVTGTKQGKYEKAFVSVYNALCRWLFGVRVTDLNSVKAYRREVMLNVPLRPDWHRYMVVIAAADGFRLDSLPVPLYPRQGRGLQVRLEADSGRRARPRLGLVPAPLRPEADALLRDRRGGCSSSSAFSPASSRWCSGSATASASARCSTWSR